VFTTMASLVSAFSNVDASDDMTTLNKSATTKEGF
jgi:hypothetical protein